MWILKSSTSGTKNLAIAVTFVCILTFAVTGCSVRINTEPTKSFEEMTEEQALEIDPVNYSSDGKYELTVHYAGGGFEKMNLGRAYIAYYPFTLQDQLDMITEDNTEEVPDLPADVQNTMNEVMGENDLQKVAVITVKTLDDQTLTVSFTDDDNAFPGREYYFVIPNEGLAGSVVPTAD